MKDKICDKSMSFKDCELAILRTAVDKAEEIAGKKVVNTPEVKALIEIVEEFIKKSNVICYGGTAINNILPKEDQFYNLDVEIPDYDFFSPNALEDAKKLADIYHSKGFEEVEAKAGQHYGTYKVFVNFIPVADITQINKKLFHEIKKESIKVAGIFYCAPNYLRMSMFLELSRPQGDVSRWEKVFKRMTLLNKHYPLKFNTCNPKIHQRQFENKNSNLIETIYNTTKISFMDQGVIFFGGYATELYSTYMPLNIRKQFTKNPDFDIISEDPYKCCMIVKERLQDYDIKDIKILKRNNLGEVIPLHYELKVGEETIAFVYEPTSCHSYNIIPIEGRKVKVATIDTMLSLYLAFIYAGRPYYDVNRILCMSNFLFQVQQKNRLKQKGLLRRFSISCYGKQKTLEEMRGDKAKKYLELMNKRNTKEYDEWFLKYRPYEIKLEKQKKKKNNEKKKTKSNKKTNKRKSVKK
jgi:hypothetical protein